MIPDVVSGLVEGRAPVLLHVITFHTSDQLEYSILEGLAARATNYSTY